MTLVQPRPPLARGNEMDVGLAHSEHLGNVHLTVAARNHAANLAHIIFGQAMPAIEVPARADQSSFFGRILHIVLVRPIPQVRRVATGSVIARVADMKHSVAAIGVEKCLTVRKRCLPIPELPVSVVGNASFPRPALIWPSLIDLLKEPSTHGLCVRGWPRHLIPSCLVRCCLQGGL